MTITRWYNKGVTCMREISFINSIVSCRISLYSFKQKRLSLNEIEEWKNFNHNAKKNELNSPFNLIYSTRCVILDNLNLSMESRTWRCSLLLSLFGFAHVTDLLAPLSSGDSLSRFGNALLPNSWCRLQNSRSVIRAVV